MDAPPVKPAVDRDLPDRDLPDRDLIERLRHSGIRIDREGAFLHEGQPVTHHGLRQAFFRWLDRLPDGRFILRLDASRFVYVDVDDTPLVAHAARVAGGQILLALSDGSEEPLDPVTLTVDDHGIMRCRARQGRLPARLSTSAAVTVADLIDETAGGPVLKVGQGAFPLGRRPAVPR